MDILRVRPAPLSADAIQHFVAMRDGVRLATDVYLGEQPDPQRRPAVLIRLPYDKCGEYTYIPQIARYITARGYVAVAQDVRGKFRSEGETLLFVNEANDGYDTIDWISKQPWCDGSVAMWGDSYFGFTQLAAASTAHPALRAIAPRLTGSRLGERPVDRPGERVRDVEMGVALMYPLSYFHSRDAFWWDPEWTSRPYIAWIERFLEAVGERSPSFDQWYPHPVTLPRFPSGSPFRERPVPTLFTIGWWDNCAPWSWSDHADMQSRPRWAINEHLLIESIDHENYVLNEPDRQAERSPAARSEVIRRTVEPALEFFDVFVREQRSPSHVPRVRWSLAQTEEIRTAEQWPLTDVDALTLYAQSDRTLTREPSSSAETVTWTHDPDDLVPSSASDAFSFLLELPDESVVGRHRDVVVFSAVATSRDLDLVGPVVAHAEVASTGRKMDLFVRLIDVSPDGTGLRIARGQVHISDATSLISVTIDMGHVGYRLRAGHHLRVHVSSSDFPEFVPQPGTGEDPFTAVRTEVNTQQLMVGGPAGFRVVLATLPSRD